MDLKRTAKETRIHLMLLAVALLSSLHGLVAAPVVDRNLVTFIFDEQSQTNPIGTGFFVGIPTKPDPTKAILYLVTAKHVLFDTKDLCKN